MFAYLRAEEARNSQNNDELVPADRSTTDEQAVVEDADDVFRIERPLLPENQVFDEEYADTDSPGHSDDDGSDDDAPATIPSSDNAPKQLEPLNREFLDADADDEDEEPFPPRKKQKRGREDTSRVDEESEEVKDEGPQKIERVKKHVKEIKVDIE
ncbi:hypothetical protein SNOG_09713 [Parastagonospora nodorum SN15]|uniref:Uncharacterized protein n=1 Tax=Phaeosphaeria nodorum (strain SN15 / ATCC MYA-4574 / FGSC 10173) TaxID=321614 RepID=Q0UEV1_PHANO|nr:hypothetical protein SNOG_09713 [Parastagonospora nodorum SN15]EAT82978.2 hypothetical protein SNOG_09713 [Parastagonospora nodorum SN15]